MRPFFLILILILPLAVWGGDNVWTSRGPIGGTFPTFTFHPTHTALVFSGSFDGLYRSTNSGATWQRSAIPGGADTPVNVRIPKQDPESIYASTESFLFRSTDQGNNWQQVSHLPVNFSDFEFHPADPNILYSVSLRKGVFRSNDGGRTWVTKNTGLRVNPVTACCDLPQLEVDPSNGNTVYVLPASRTLFRSTNGADSWVSQNGLKLTDESRGLIIDPKITAIIYAAGGEGVYKSTNSGAAWSFLNCDCEAAGIAMDPKNGQIIYAAGDGLKKSTNGGNTWVKLANSGPTANIRFASVRVSLASSSQVLLGGDGGGIFRSQNGGQTAKPVNNLVDAIPSRHVSSSPARPTDIFAQGDYQVFRSKNGGTSWELWPLGHDFQVQDVRVHSKNANVVAVAGYFEDACVAVSSNGGAGWVLRGPGGADGANAIAMDPNNDSILFVAAVSGGQKLGMARSMDQGRSWSFINSGLTDKSIIDILVDPTNGANVYVASTSGKVFKSNNGGSSWKNSSAGLKRGVVYSLDLDRSNSNTLYAATESGVYKSINAGQNWTFKSKGIPPNVEVLFVRIDPSNPQVLFCGGEDLLFVSADAGENWSAYDTNGLGRYLATDMLINPAQPSTFHLGVNRGVFSYKKSAVAGGPEILQLSPSSGKAGDTIVIQGKNFGSSQGGSKVLFGTSDSGTSVSWTDAKIQARVPSGAQTGTVSVQVGSRKSNGLQFVVVASSGLQPASGPAAGGTLVSIVTSSRVSNFSFVLFGSSLAKDVRFLPPNTIVCRTPPGSGTVNVSVVGVAGAVQAGTFSYQ